MAVDRIGHAFVDQGLLAQALTHRSAGAPHNERLEFLGDGVVNLLIAEALFQRWPKADEGAMTRARAELVREASLATIARTLQLGERLTMGPGEMKSGGHRRGEPNASPGGPRRNPWNPARNLLGSGEPGGRQALAPPGSQRDCA